MLVLAARGPSKFRRMLRRLAGRPERARLRRAGVRGHLRWEWTAHQSIAVEVVPDLAPHAAFISMRDRCAEVLERHGVSYAITSTSPWRRQSFAIPETEWEQALRVLAHELSSSPTYFVLGAKLLGVRSVVDYFHVSRSRAVKAAASRSSVLLCTMRSRGVRAPVLQDDYGVRLQRWEASAAWAAPVGNETATRVPLDAFDTTVVKDENGSAVRRFVDVPHESFTQPRFPIDVVYLWVDGGDPVWQEERARVLGTSSVQGEPSQGTWLFRDRDELLYSLRSLEENAPWVRKVHLLTANQVPPWLNLKHPRLEVHFQRDIFAEPQALPTYNSHAIESQIHRIPGLSEHYIVMNDDVFFGRPVEPSQFFSPGGVARFRYSRHHAPSTHDSSMSAIEQARHHTAGVIEEIHGAKPHALFAHTPLPQRRSAQEQLEKIAPDEFRQTMYSRTRHATDLVPLSWLHLNHLYLSGLAVEGHYQYRYYFLAERVARKRLGRMLNSERPHVFCLNDGPDVDGLDYSEWLVTALEHGFPVASSFELPKDEWREHVHMESVSEESLP